MSEIPISNTKEVIGTILYETKELEWKAFDQRDEELISGLPNANRVQLLYYPAIKAYQEAQDKLFQDLLPKEFRSMAVQFRSCEERWVMATKLAQQFQNELHIGTPSKGGIVDSRAKSLFTIWEKLQRYKLEPNEIFDTVGVRITTKDIHSARAMKTHVIANSNLLKPHSFKNLTDKIHQPISDTLDIPNERGFSFIRLTLMDEFNFPYELQIQTLEGYQRWRKHEKEVMASLAASPKYGLLVDLE